MESHPPDSSVAESRTQSRSATEAPAVTPGQDLAVDIDRLVTSFRKCFDDLGVRTEEQTARLEKAFEALRPKPPVVDNKTAFWNAYKTVADEYDREFQQKYSTDLDTTLIFAGLFSAVSSAFIIQIQPELQPDPNDMTHALLRLLIHNVNGSIFSGPDISIPQWSGPPTVIVVVQCLLYGSLASTLLAALLAVLGKQWLMYYNAAGERGNIEQRCLERQRKFDGMRRWRFDPVMQMFPLLLQFSLLFFAGALAIYLWTIHHSVAAVVLSLSALGLGIYIFLGMSAVISPDSPFRNPLTDYWITAVSRVRLVLGSILQRVSLVLQPILARVVRYRERHFFYRIAKAKRRLLKFYSSKMESSQMTADDKIPILGDRYNPPDPSPSLPAVLWVLETSTDPELVNAAAGMVEELQWPEVLDVTSPMNRLLDIFIACFDKEKGWKIRDSALERAIRCGRAYLVLRLVHQSWKRQDLDHDRDYHFSFWALKTDNQELSDIRLLALSLNARVLYRAVSPPSQKLVLQIFPTLISQHDGYNPGQDLVEEIDRFLDHANQRMDLNEDSSLFADYLFCLNCFFDQANSDEIACIDKSEYQGLMITRLFHNLLRCAMSRHTIVKIVKTTVRLASKVENNERTFGAQDAINRRIAIYAFCAQSVQESVGGIPAALSAINLAQDSMDIASAITEFRPSVSLVGPVLHGDIPEVNRLSLTWELARGLALRTNAWVFNALQHAWTATNVWDESTTRAIGALLETLAFVELETDAFPTPEALHIILGALFQRNHAISEAAFFILYRKVKFWFDEENLRSIMQEAGLWSFLGYCAQEHPHRLGHLYIEMGDILSTMPDWKPFMFDVHTWITVYLRLPQSPELGGRKSLQIHFQNALIVLWNAQTEDARRGDYREVALIFSALVNFWKNFNFADNINQFVAACRDTFDIALEAAPPDPDFKAGLMLQFVDAIAHAASNAQRRSEMDSPLHPSQSRRDELEGATILLTDLAEAIKAEMPLSRSRAATVRNMAESSGEGLRKKKVSISKLG